MNEQTRVPMSAELQAEVDMLEQAAQRGLARRRASGRIFTYELDGWVVQEHPGGRIERLATVANFRAADHPYPGFVEPKA